MKAQLVNLKDKFSQPTSSDAQLVQGLGSQEGPPRLFYGLSNDAMVRGHVLFSAHNSSLTPKFATSFCPFYFMAQEANVAPKVSTTRQVIQTDGLAFGSSPITKARRARVVML